MGALGFSARAQRLIGGSRTVPRTRWTAASRWRTRPTTLAVLLVGLSAFGFGQALQVQAGLGNGPWTVLAQGLSVRAGMDLGVASLVVSVGVLALWIPFREPPGLGTILNIVVIAAVLAAGVRVIPPQTDIAVQLAMTLVGIAMVGVGSGLYLTCGLGPGPRDGWMTAAHRRTGWPVARVRLLLEVAVLLAGWGLGGTVGLGTVLFALLIGRAIAIALGIAGRAGGATGYGASIGETGSDAVATAAAGDRDATT